MTIRIQVQAQQAIAQLNAVNAAMARAGAAARTSGSGAAFAGATASANNFVTRGLEPATKAAKSFGTTMRNMFDPQMASKTQWLGRQLTYNFSMPLGIAGVAATKWALDTETAVTRVAKVYGDNTAVFSKKVGVGVDFRGMTKDLTMAESEIAALAKSFTALSDKYGVAQAEVANIGADWAQAGASGIAVAKDTELTLRTMVLAEMDAKDATTALISTMAQYSLTSGEMSKALDVMNMVENTSAANFSDLLTVFKNAAGPARQAGVGIRELAALTASLVPATGSAATAGNSLKTIFTRLLNPTKQGIALLGKMGINIHDLNWQSETGTQRLMTLAKAFDQLSSAQKTTVAATIGSVYQINKFDVVMEDIIKKHGRYQTALRATASATDNYKQSQKELQMVLDSNPQKIKQIWTILQNAMIDVVQPMLPMIIHFGQIIADLMKKFADLDPRLQQFITSLLLAIVVLGPLLRLISSFRILLSFVIEPMMGLIKLFGLLGTAAKGVAAILLAPFNLLREALLALVDGIATAFTFLWASIIKVFTGGMAGLVTVLRTLGAGILDFFLGIPGLVLLAVAAVVAIFHKQFATIWDNVVKAAQNSETAFGQIAQGIASIWAAMVKFVISVFNKLPEGIQRALIAVVTIVEKAALAVYQLLQYMNPFAHHSPSLVESVTWGMAVIGKEYSKMGAVGDIFNKAAADLKNFKAVANSIQPKPFADARASVAQAKPSALPAFDKSVGDVARLTAMQNQLSAAITIQTAKVAGLQTALDGLNATLDKQNKILQQNQTNLSNLQDQYNTAKDAASAYATAPLKGMGEMSDKMFANSMAAKKLQLQMADWTKAHGSIDDINTQVANLQGTIEDLTARRTELRQKGAGSEILGPLNQQIEALQKQQAGLATNGDAYSKMADQLKTINDEGTRLDLLNSITFDPLTRQLDKLANGQKEISYDDAVKGINKQKAAMDALTPKIKAATDAVNSQQKVVDRATAARDAAQNSLDAQNKTLQDMKSTYDELGNAISDITSALNDVASAADKINTANKAATASTKALTASMENFNAGAGANWPDPGGTGSGTVGREGGTGDQTKAIDDFTKKITDGITADLKKGFGGDMFKPLKDKWIEFTTWWKNNIAGPVGQVWTGIQGVFSNFGHIFDGVDFKKTFQDKLQPVLAWLTPAWDTVVKVWNGVFPTLKQGFEDAISGIKSGWQSLSDSFQPFIKQVMPLLKDAWNIFLGLLEAVGVAIIAVVGFVAGELGPTFETIGKLIGDAIGILEGFAQGIHGIFQFIAGLLDILTGHWHDGWKEIGDGIDNIAIGIMKILDKLGKGLWDMLSGFAKIIWGGIKGAFKAITGTMAALGHDIVSGVWKGIKDRWNAFIKWLGSLWKKLVDAVKWYLDIHSPSGVFAEIGKAIIDGLWAGIKAAASLLGELGKWILNTIWDGIKFVWTTMLTWFGNIGTWIWDKIKSLAAFFGTIGTNIWNWIGNAVTTAATTLATWFSHIGTWIWDKVKSLAVTIGNIGTSIWNWIGNAVTTAAVKLATWFSHIGSWIWSKVKNVARFVANIGTNLWNWLGNAVTTAANKLGTWFASIGSWIWSKVKNLSRTIANIGTSIWNWLGNAVTTAASKLGSWFSSIGSWIWDKVKNLSRTIGNIGVNIWNWIGNAVKNTAVNLWTWFSNIGTWIWNAIKNLAAVVGNSGKNIWGWFANAITNAATTLWTWFGNMGKTIWSHISSWIGDAVTWGENIIKGIIEGMGHLAKAVWDAITDLFTGKKGGSSGLGSIVPFPIPGQAEGGRVRGPGGPRDDKVLRRLSDGEYVVRASSVNIGKNERILNQMNYGGLDVAKLLPGYAAGGKISSHTKYGTPIYAMPPSMFAFDPNKAYKAMGVDIGMGYDNAAKRDDNVLRAGNALNNKLNPQLNVPPGTGVQRWSPLFWTALTMIAQATQPNLAAGLHQMQTESGGNPRAINLTDVNAINGVPSKGLMQVIDPTFKRYALPGYDKDIWDPLSNILASARYTIAAYGSLLNGWQGHAYRNGGLVGGRGTGTSDSNLLPVSKGEFIIPADMYRKNKSAIDSIYAGGARNTATSYARNAGVLSAGPVTNTTTININGDLSFPNITSGNDASELVNSVSRMAKMGVR